MRKIWFFVKIVVILFILSFLLSKFFINKDSFVDKIAIIPIKGIITSGDFEDFLFSEGSTSSTKIAQFIRQADTDINIKGILLEINSPGGTVVASKEIAYEVNNAKKPVVAWIREIGTSGAYWVASAADKIVADPLSITGSIGVMSSYLEFSELMDRYGVNYERLVSGEFKDTGSPYKKLDKKERSLLQSKIDIIHKDFIDEIVKNRNLEIVKATKIGDGSFYLGKEAKELGLIDYLGGRELAINITKQLSNITEAKLVTYKEKRRITDVLSRIGAYSSFFIGRGIGKELIKKDYFNIVA